MMSRAAACHESTSTAGVAPKVTRGKDGTVSGLGTGIITSHESPGDHDRDTRARCTMGPRFCLPVCLCTCAFKLVHAGYSVPDSDIAYWIVLTSSWLRA
eukprot:3204529-Rhodomonas_salina.3